MDEKDLREKFEQWYSDNSKYSKVVERSGGDGSYIYMGTATAWAAWQACAAALSQKAEAPGWLPIETMPTDCRVMFVVRAFGVCNGNTGGKQYTSDPYCVWNDAGTICLRWPHAFQPTHWMPLPAAPKDKP